MTEQTRWASDEAKLECYKTIGQFDPSMLVLDERSPGKGGLEAGRELIKLFVIGTSEIVEGQLRNGANGDAISLVQAWMLVAAKAVPGCVKYMAKVGEQRFPVIEPLLKKLCGEDKELLAFYLTLRPQLFSILNRLYTFLSPRFAAQPSTKLARRTITCLVNTINIFFDYKQLSRSSQISFGIRSKKLFKNPTFKDYARRYSYYTEDINNMRQQITQHYEKKREFPFLELKLAFNNVLETIAQIPNLVRISQNHTIVESNHGQNIKTHCKSARSQRKGARRDVPDALRKGSCTARSDR